MMIRIHQVIDTMIHESKVEKSLIKCRNYVFHYINLSCVSKKTNHHFHHGEEINFKALVHVLNSACTSFILITLIHFSFEYLIVFFVSFSHPDQNSSIHFPDFMQLILNRLVRLYDFYLTLHFVVSLKGSCCSFFHNK